MKNSIINKKSGRIVNLLAYIFFFVCLLPAVIFVYRKPHHNWDMLAYMALAVKIDNPDINAIHTITYTAAKENIPEYDYKLLTSPESKYRARLAASATDFYSQLPFYVVKPLYIWLVYLGHRSGLSLPSATIVPCMIAFLLSGMLLFHWLKKYMGLFACFIASLLIMYSGYMISTARISSPDSLSAFFMFAAFYFIIERPPNTLFVFLLFLVSILIRVDNIIAATVITTFLCFSKRWSKRITIPQYVLMIACFTGLYFAITNIATNYGWDKSYYSSFLHTANGTFDFHDGFSIKRYAALMYSKAIGAVIFSHFSFFALMSLLMIAIPWPIRFRQLPFSKLFVLLLFCIMLIRFSLFPDLSDRFYTGFYLLITVLFIRQFVEMVLSTGSNKPVSP